MALRGRITGQGSRFRVLREAVEMLGPARLGMFRTGCLALSGQLLGSGRIDLPSLSGTFGLPPDMAAR